MTFAVGTAMTLPLKYRDPWLDRNFNPPMVAALTFDTGLGSICAIIDAVALAVAFNPTLTSRFGIMDKIGKIGGFTLTGTAATLFIVDTLALIIQKKRGHI